jgi:hypothetical protein
VIEVGVKKVIGCSILTSVIIAFHVAVINGSLDYKLCHLKRKVNCLNRKVNKVLNGMSQESLKKYEQEIKDAYENIKNKVDNITLKDIKDKGSEVIENIYEGIMNFKQKLISYN